MIVTFVSQCEKKALPRTRRVLDAFANRIGDNTWQTVITEDGLLAAKRLLRKTASKSTAVSCHWIRSRRLSELMWIVGNRNKFNTEGHVPVNSTQKSLQPWKSSHLWQNLELIALASSIAGLFHDFGKANDLFQDKLNPAIKSKKTFEPFRHEWVSLKIFEAFASGQTDEQWLKKLLYAHKCNEEELLSILRESSTKTLFYDSFQHLPPFAQLVAWLIVSHHRLLVFPFFASPEPTLDNNDNTLGGGWLNEVDVKWNSPNYVKYKDEWTLQEKVKNWTFSFGLPLRSPTWQKKASQIAKRALRQMAVINQLDWKKDILTTHLARLMLMLADHWYSAQGITQDWQHLDYLAYANTDKNFQLKQKLDEHNLAVSHYAYLYSHQLPNFLAELPDLGVNSVLQKGLKDSDALLSKWQDIAFKLSQKINVRSNECGFFGINMASTGQGKTIANARIMYGLADEERGCRLSIALGLRTLTTQTGTALSKNLGLDKSEIATLIGSAAIQKLLNANQQEENLAQQQRQLLEELEKTALALRGSESLDQGDDEFEIDYPNIEPDSLLDKLFKNDAKLQKLLHAPILVSTIDHLIPATEGIRGGRQIAPMLRLLSSDLILDEPDEFSLEDLPALARLVHWAGLLGSKVLLSSATIPVAMACALFEAYSKGRQLYQQAMLGQQQTRPVVCAWFDEFSVKSAEVTVTFPDYGKMHNQFVNERIEQLLANKTILRKGRIIEIEEGNNFIDKLSTTILKTILTAHRQHQQSNDQGINISLGVVRFANIDPLVAVAQALIQQEVPEDYCIHYCIYHSQFTLAQRSSIEEKLDRILNRKQSEAIWQQPEIKTAIERHPQIKHHVFVVLATSVCEVGRDHDYDWAIAEPSSMRSLIQLAGRLQRHRKQPVQHENLFILNMNVRALRGKQPAFTKPGFEAKHRALIENKEIKNLLTQDQYKNISAIPSIKALKPFKAVYSNLVELEQNAYWMTLFGKNDEANNAQLWWTNDLSWSGELQRQQPFRKSTADYALIYRPNSRGQLRWHLQDKKERDKLTETHLVQDFREIKFSKNNCIWFKFDELDRYQEISELVETSLERIFLNYGEVRMPERERAQYLYHPFLGVFSEINR